MTAAPILIFDEPAAREVYACAFAGDRYATHYVDCEADAVALAQTARREKRPIQTAFVSFGLDGGNIIDWLWDVDPDIEMVICVSTPEEAAEVQEMQGDERYLLAHKPLQASTIRQMAHAQVDAWKLRHQMQSHVWDLELQHAGRIRAVSRLAAGMAHEINSPIQFLGDSVAHVEQSHQSLLVLVEELDQLLRRAEDPQLRRDAMAAIATADLAWVRQEAPRTFLRMRDGHQRIADVVSSLQAFASPDFGVSLIADLNEEVRQALQVSEAIYAPVADVRLDFAQPHRVKAAPRDMRHVFLQLISNAADAIREHEGLTRGEIKIETRYQAGWATVSFRDNGTGLPPIQQAASGHGLAICRDIVDRHGGAISFQNEPGHGSTFNIQVPMEVAS